MTTSYIEPQTRLSQSEKEQVQFYIEKQQLSSGTDGFEIEKTTSDRKSRGLQYNCDGAMT